MEIEIIEKVDPKEYGLQEEKAKPIENAFFPKIAERDGLKEIYVTLLTKEINEDVANEARKLRLKLVKVRTGVAEVHKVEKAFHLAAGKYCDAWKNKITLPVTQMEERLTEIENHFDNLEDERRKKLKEERLAQLAQYDSDGEFMDLVNMPEDIFDTYLDGIKIGYDAKIEEERLEEKEKLRLQAVQKLHDTRTNDLYDSSLWTFANKAILSELGGLCDSDYKDIRDDALKAKKDYEAEQVRIKKENQRLKKAAEAKAKQEKIESDKRAKAETERKAKEEKDRKIRDQKQAEEKAIADAKLKKEKEKSARIAEELRLKKEAEEKAEADKQAEIEADLKKGDTARVRDLVIDLEALKTKYEFKFKSKKNRKLYRDCGLLIDKVVGHMSKK